VREAYWKRERLKHRQEEDDIPIEKE